MPKEKNRLLRVVVPIVAVVAAIGVVAAVYTQTAARTARPGAAPTTTAKGEPPKAGEPPAQAPAPGEAAPVDTVAGSTERKPAAPATPGPAGEGDAAAAPAKPAAQTATPVPDLRARLFPAPAEDLASIGGDDPKGRYAARIEFTPLGAGVEAITLADFYDTVGHKGHYRVQERQTYAADGRQMTVASLAARGVEVNGRFVDLFSTPEGKSIWRQTGPGAFEAFIDDASGAPVARIERRYEVAPGSYDIRLVQTLFNLGEGPLKIRWYQYGPVDLEMGDTGYGGDKRRVRFGYLPPQSSDPSRQIVVADDKLVGRDTVIGKAGKNEPPAALIWPNKDAGAGTELVWAAMTNRYFTFAVHPLIDAEALASGAPVDKRFADADEVYGVVLGPKSAQGTLILQLNGPLQEVPAGGSLDLSLGAYAGPLWRKVLDGEPIYRALEMGRLVVYNLGGPCSFCTFQWLAQLLFWFLSFLHDYVLHDWALAILALVVCVRATLHPVTRRSQIGLQRFSKQMQALGPKQQKLREKFKDDPKKLQAEMIKLYREEGVRFSGALGCLPMFLQSPVWIALYAMLYFAFELRQTPAFFGVFQALSGGRWSFLGDLSAPDRFIDFGRDIVTLPLLGPIHSINILPLVLGVVFFLQQKYLTPPPSAAMTPEQETQQKIMKVMMVVMFPLFMYNAPSGMALYFITNSVLGIVESRYIRAHITKMDLEPPKPAPEPGRKQVANTGKNPFSKLRGREGSPWKERGRK